MAGVIPSIINVIILAINPDVELSGFICFIFALATTIICLGLTFAMERTTFYQFYYAQLSTVKEDLKKEPFLTKIINVAKETIDIYMNLGLSVWNYIFITFINFTTTLCVFPAVCGLAESYEFDGNCYFLRLRPGLKVDIRSLKHQPLF